MTENHEGRLRLLAVSDGTGETVERLVDSALLQFEGVPVEVIRHGAVRSADRVRRIIEEAAEGGPAIVVHTLVSQELRGVILKEGRAQSVDTLDMMGPLLERCAERLHLSPRERPGLLKQIVDAKTRRIEAVDFAFLHDDGRNADDLSRAEVLLVGVSRTMKTPTMLYLAYSGWFAANVPLVPDVPLDEAVTSFPSRQVFCLVMTPERLMELRRVRAEATGIPLDTYASRQQVRRELHDARTLCRKHGWRIVDVTVKSVEEAGREIAALLPKDLRTPST